MLGMSGFRVEMTDERGYHGDSANEAAIWGSRG